jgi:hypothetical protein
MTTTAAGRDLSALLDAYALLEVPLSATAGEVRRSYRRLARTQHPDRFPGGSAEQQAATSRMALLNRAYDLIQDAPLRHHPISRGSEPVFDDSDASVATAVRRARSGRVYRHLAAAVGFAVMATVAFAIVVGLFQAMGIGQRTAVLLAMLFVACAFPLRRTFDPLRAADGLVTLLRFLGAR